MGKLEAPTIETERLILRRKMECDIPNMVKMFNTEDVRKYLGGYPPRDERSMLGMIRHRNNNQWAVILKKNEEFIGECLLSNVTDNIMGHIGYIFMKKYWGKGYSNEAVSEIINYSKCNLGLKRLYASIDKNNIRSIKFTEKLNFEYIALLPEYNFGGRVADVLYYSKIL